MFFLKRHSPLVKEKNPTITFSELGQTIGAMWKATNTDDRQEYETSAVRDRKRFASEMAVYQQVQQATFAGKSEVK